MAYATISGAKLESYDETICLPAEIHIHDDGLAVAVHGPGGLRDGDYGYDSLAELLRHYKITAESWQATLPAKVRCHLAGEDAARTYFQEFRSQPHQAGARDWLAAAFEAEVANQDWPDNSYADVYEPAFRAALAKLQTAWTGTRM